MRVVHLSCVAPPDVGGIGSVAWRTVTGLRAHGVDASLWAPRPLIGSQDTSYDRQFVTRLRPLYRLGNASVLPGVREVFAQADVVHLHYPFYGVAEPLLLTHPPKPVVVTFHMDAYAGDARDYVFAAHRALLQSTMMNHASRVVVSSLDYGHHSSLGSWMARHMDRVEELPFAVDTDTFTPGPRTPERFGLSEATPVVSFVAGLDAAHVFKGLPVLMDALQEVEGVHVLVVGDGDRRASYEALAQKKNLRHRMTFLGRVDTTTLRDVYRTAHAHTFPSTTPAEAFGLVALEAQACGCPVIASDLPGVRTVVKREETGVLVPPQDAPALALALRSLLEDTSRRERMSVQARTRACGAYSWETHLRALQRIYRDVCA